MRILIAEDQKAMQERIKAFLNRIPEVEVVGFAENGQVAIEKTKQLHPDVILVDLFMPVMDGLTATTIISQRFKSIRILILTGQEAEEDEYLTKALMAGAKGYLLKKNLSKNLINALQVIDRGSLYLSPTEEVNNALPGFQSSTIAPLTYWLAKEVLFQWCQQPIEPLASVADILEDLGVKNKRSKSEIIDFLDKTPKNTTLTSEILSKIENLQTQQSRNKRTYSKSNLLQIESIVKNWFESADDPSLPTPTMILEANFKFLRIHSLNKIRNRLTQLWQTTGTEPLLNHLQALELDLQNAAEEYERSRQHYLFKTNSAWRAYNKLAIKLDTENNRKKDNWESACNALKLTYQFKSKAKIYFFAYKLVIQLIEQIQMYCKTLTATNKLLKNLQYWFAEHSSLRSVLLPSLLVHLTNEVDFYKLRNQFEMQTGHFINQWGVSSSISEDILREKIIIFIQPIATQLYINSCRQALFLF